MINSQRPQKAASEESAPARAKPKEPRPVIKHRGAKRTAIVQEVFDIAHKYPETYLIRFTFEDEDEVFDFHPGQFISIFAEKDGKRVSRPYSIASSPQQKDFLELAIKVVEGGFMSNLLHHIPVGTKLQTIAPLGGFILLEPVEAPIVFIATGTGVAPFRSMIEYIFHQETDQPIHLYHGVRYVEDIIYQDVFEKLAEKHDNFHYELTVSRPGDDWKGRKGYVQELVKDRISDGTGMHAYMCGMAQMIEDNTKLCRGLNFDLVRAEKWD